MIDCIFTIDYEIFGDGSGGLKELVYKPAEQIRTIFEKYGFPLVVFVEAAELEMIESAGTDPAIGLVKRQVREFYDRGFEIALHLHPQWYNARFQNGEWILDYCEYSLCGLPRERIREIIRRAVDYLRVMVGSAEFTPQSFRAGNWLLQPTKVVAEVLMENGIRIDSSLFKGGLQRSHWLDYRPALKNDYFWSFGSDVNIPDVHGGLMEVPTYTVMVPFWTMLTAKRVGLMRKSSIKAKSAMTRINQCLDAFRPWYPLKFDFCRMTFNELTSMIDGVEREDERTPELYKPIVAIGHTKDVIDLETVDRFLSYLKKRRIPGSRLDEILNRTVAT